MTSASLNLLVLYVSDLNESRKFYELLGLDLTLEQHGPEGPVHYSAELSGGLILELYPAPVGLTSRVRLGLQLPDPAARRCSSCAPRGTRSSGATWRSILMGTGFSWRRRIGQRLIDQPDDLAVRHQHSTAEVNRADSTLRAQRVQVARRDAHRRSGLGQ